MDFDIKKKTESIFDSGTTLHNVQHIIQNMVVENHKSFVFLEKFGFQNNQKRFLHYKDHRKSHSKLSN